MAESLPLSVGRLYENVEVLPKALIDASASNFDFVACPITNNAKPTATEIEAFRTELVATYTRPDTVLNSDQWQRFIVAQISDWINIDSDDSHQNKLHRIALESQLGYALHLGNPAILVPLTQMENPNLAALLHKYIKSSQAVQYWIQVPLVSELLCQATDEEQEHLVNERAASNRPKHMPWEWWNYVRCMIGATTRIAVALEISTDVCNEATLQQWEAEPVKSLIIPHSIFLTNAKGFPVLSKAHQHVVRRLLKLKPQILIKGGSDSACDKCHKYLQHLGRTQPEPSVYEKFTNGYEDFLEIPLQPLMDHLQSSTYEIFEKDPVKYDKYQEAIRKALIHRVPEDKKDSQTVVVMVVGAGRGPIVRASLEAARQADRKVRVYAVEKNPNAVITLQHIKKEEWHDSVQVFSGDMHAWDAPEQADILVSELLGSWGDNELSPECLDGAQRFLKEDGISIPSKYTSYVAPVSAHKVHTELATNSGDHHLEKPYVVRLHNHARLGAVQKLFEFEHPNPAHGTAAGIDNTRYLKVSARVSAAGLMHGFGGYFDAQLFDDVMISIHPDTHTTDMFSWFPMFIPIRNPIYVNAGDVVEGHFWRQVDAHKVWYEWAVASPQVSALHNAGGQHSFIGL